MVKENQPCACSPLFGPPDPECPQFLARRARHEEPAQGQRQRPRRSPTVLERPAWAWRAPWIPYGRVPACLVRWFARSRHWQVCTWQRPRCAHARATMPAGRFALSYGPCRCVVATQCVCMGRWTRHRRGPTAHAAGGANACGCTLKLAQEWRQMRSAVGETARKDADGASERRDNDTALSIARLRAARGTGIYE